jgi:hypothetical protein
VRLLDGWLVALLVLCLGVPAGIAIVGNIPAAERPAWNTAAARAIHSLSLMRTLLLALGAAFSISSASAADYFPLQQGNTWTYQNNRTGQSLTVSVGSPVVLNERVYHMLRGYLEQPLLVRINERKDLVQVDEETGREQTLTSFAPLDYTWWEAPSRICPQEGQTLERRGVHDGPAGPVQEVLEIKYRIFGCADVGTDSEQYAENIGMLRRINTSIIGPQRLDLVYARVGNIQIDARPHASFTVSVLSTQQSQDVTALLRLQTNSLLALKLLFATGQEYDVAVRDEKGNVIWKYSDGRFFTQAEHEISVIGGWSTTVQIPRSVLSGGNYAVQGWLTTAGPNPQFAATMPVTITDSSEDEPHL